MNSRCASSVSVTGNLSPASMAGLFVVEMCPRDKSSAAARRQPGLRFRRGARLAAPPVDQVQGEASNLDPQRGCIAPRRGETWQLLNQPAP